VLRVGKDHSKAVAKEEDELRFEALSSKSSNVHEYKFLVVGVI
jgi:hypothetical protein